jgi:hypothetical protein
MEDQLPVLHDSNNFEVKQRDSSPLRLAQNDSLGAASSITKWERHPGKFRDIRQNKKGPPV